MPIYNKLVRDLIPDIIRKSGKTPVTSVLSNQDYVVALRTKLSEEVNEYLSANEDTQALDELADILEIISTLTAVHNSSLQEVLSIQTDKNRAHGGFREKIYLIEVKDES